MSDIKAFLFDDDRGVSPVIGVILMVAITVILAAVIAAFVLGLGDSSEPAPSTSFDYDYNEADDILTVTVQSGETFEAGNAQVTGAVSGDLGGGNAFSSDTSIVSAGDSFTVGPSSGSADITGSNGVEAGQRLDITFTPEEGGESSILGTFTAPEN